MVHLWLRAQIKGQVEAGLVDRAAQIWEVDMVMTFAMLACAFKLKAVDGIPLDEKATMQ